MKITTESREGSGIFGKRATYYRVSEQVDCCEDMTQAFKDGFIGFGEWDSMSLIEVAKVCIYKINCWAEGASGDHMQINSCPFCGQRIEIDWEVQV